MSHLDVTVSSNLEACNWDIMICIYIMNHHESWCHRCILPTPFHQKSLKHRFILWCKISSRFYLVWSPVLRPLLPQILYQICTTQVQRWYASFSLLGPAGMFLTEVRQRRLQASWNEGGVVVRINSCLRGNSWQVSSFSTWSVPGDVDRYWYCSLGGGFKS